MAGLGCWDYILTGEDRQSALCVSEALHSLDREEEGCCILSLSISTTSSILPTPLLSLFCFLTFPSLSLSCFPTLHLKGSLASSCLVALASPSRATQKLLASCVHPLLLHVAVRRSSGPCTLPCLGFRFLSLIPPFWVN